MRQNQAFSAAEGNRKIPKAADFFLGFVPPPPIPPQADVLGPPPQELEKPTPPGKILGPPRPWACMITWIFLN